MIKACCMKLSTKKKGIDNRESELKKIDKNQIHQNFFLGIRALIHALPMASQI